MTWNGAFRTSPVELPLEQRRIKLYLQYITKLKSTPSNPAYECIFRPNYEHKYLTNTKVTAPLGIRMKEHRTLGRTTWEWTFCPNLRHPF